MQNYNKKIARVQNFNDIVRWLITVGRAVLIILRMVHDSSDYCYCYTVCCTIRPEVTTSDCRDILTSLDSDLH